MECTVIRLNLEESPRSYLEFLVVVVMASTSRNRDIGRSYESGHEKRKKKALEEEKQRKDMASMPKITDLFCRPKPPSTHVEVEPTALVSEPNVSVEEEPEPPRPQSPSKSNHCLTDPATWTAVTDELRTSFIAANYIQVTDISFINSAHLYDDGRTRYLTSSMFFRKLPNDETVKRTWLLYSQTSGRVYCSACKLFSGSVNQFTSGFNDWKNSYRLVEHENSVAHRNSVVASISLGKSEGHITSHLEAQFEMERGYWMNVLRRVVTVVKFLAQRGLAFRGQDEILGSCNNGNFLGLIELLSQFDPFLASHISRYGNAGRGSVSYLSSTTCNEFIQLMAKEVLLTIISQVKTAKYFAISVDSTPDISHVDQLTLILRFIDLSGKPVERFIKFIPISSHDGETLSKVILETLSEYGISISDCRGQSYDNASNMSGKYGGVQARLKRVNKLVEFVPCSAHSLNLVGTCAAECCVHAVSFFGMVQALFNFFSASTHRWAILSACIDGIVPKSLSTTRWSARADATRALRHNYSGILSALQQLANDKDQTATARNDASSLATKMETLEMAVLCVVWDSILERFNSTSKTLQKVNIDLATCVSLYESLHSFISSIRTEEAYLSYEDKAKLLVEDSSYRAEHARARKRRRLFNEVDSEVQLSPRERFRTSTYLPILDSLLTELVRRTEVYSKLKHRFGFLFTLLTSSEAELRESARKFQAHFSTDIAEEVFEDELIQFVGYIKQYPTEDVSPPACLRRMREHGISEAFPNVDTAFRLYLTLPVANTEGERSFSVLKRVKNQLHSTVGQEKLCDLSLLTIEADLTNNINFESIVAEFAKLKSRKKTL